MSSVYPGSQFIRAWFYPILILLLNVFVLSFIHMQTKLTCFIPLGLHRYLTEIWLS